MEGVCRGRLTIALEGVGRQDAARAELGLAARLIGVEKPQKVKQLIRAIDGLQKTKGN